MIANQLARRNSGPLDRVAKASEEPRNRRCLILRQVAELEAQYMGDQLQQVVSRPD